MKTGIGTAALGILLACVVGVFAGYANDEQKTLAWTIEGRGNVTQNEDGTYTFSRSGKIAFADGRVATHSAQKLVTRGEKGLATWTGTRARANSDGETITVVTEGTRTVTRNEDGSRVIRMGETVTLSDGRTIAINGQRNVARNDDGTVSWTASHSASRSDGATATRSATGGGVRSGDQFSWQSAANGVNFRGRNWSSATTGRGRNTENGCAWNISKSGQTEDGISINMNREGTLARDGGNISVAGGGARTATK